MNVINVHWFKLESLKELLESGDLHTLDDGKYVKLEPDYSLHECINTGNLYAEKSKAGIED